MAKVTVKIDPTKGTTEMELEGFQGTSCEEVTKAIMQNNEVLDHEYTEEYCVPEELPDFVEDGSVEE